MESHPFHLDPVFGPNLAGLRIIFGLRNRLYIVNFVVQLLILHSLHILQFKSKDFHC